MASNSRTTVNTAFALMTLLAITGVRGHAQIEGVVSSAIHSQYLQRGRDYTLAGAPMVAIRGRAQAHTSVGQGLRSHVELSALHAIARRGSPWEAGTSDTIRFSAGAESVFFDGGRLGVGLGVEISWFYAAMMAGGATYGTVVIEPHLNIGPATAYGRPQWSAVLDLTPDQVGWRGGIEWFPTFEVPWGEIEGYAGFFRPHNYLKQKSHSFFRPLFAGELGTAVVALIPSDITIGAGTIFKLTPEMALYPEVELLVAPNRSQNPKQIVPAASLTFHYGGLGARAPIHYGR